MRAAAAAMRHAGQPLAASATRSATPTGARSPTPNAPTGCVSKPPAANPKAPSTSGLVAYLDGEPVGWCATEPRTAYPRLLRTRTPWVGRDEEHVLPHRVVRGDRKSTRLNSSHVKIS